MIKDPQPGDRAGETVALVGQTGAGKSTVARLPTRMYDVDAGSISIDGVDLRDLSFADLSGAWSDRYPRTFFLFNGTIRENIAYGKPGAKRRSTGRSQRSMRTGYSRPCPQGLETQWVKKKGYALGRPKATGLLFARDLTGRPRVLILDEATSNMDAYTGGLIQKGLERLPWQDGPA